MAHSSKNISLSEYLQDVDKEIILVPKFQRDFVWDQAQMIKLAASILKGYPIGSFLLMQDTGEYASRKIEGIEREEDQYTLHENKENTLLILDGQQRTTTAYQIFYGKGDFRFYFDFGQFVEDLKDEIASSIQDLIEDKIEEWLVALPIAKAILNPDEQRSKGLFPLDIIFNGDGSQNYSEWTDTYCMSNSLVEGFKIDKPKNDRLSKCKGLFMRHIIQCVTSYQASEIIIDKNTSPNVVCTIFETINSTGQKLTILDLLNAKCFPYKFMLRQELDDSLAKYPILQEFEMQFESIIGVSIVRTIGLLCKKSSKKSDLLALKANEIREYWESAVIYVKSALDYMKIEYGVVGPKYLPYKDMIPIIAVIINNPLFSVDLSNKDKLSRWYWNAVFSGYFDNATESKHTKTIKELLGNNKEKGWFEDDTLIPDIIRIFSINNLDELEKLTSIQSAKYKAVHNLIILNGAQDFCAERKPIESFNEKDLQDHHIYPKKFLSLYKIKGKEANTILNRTLIGVGANQKIKDAQPIHYLNDKKIVGVKFSKKELDKHCINHDVVNETFSKEAYDMFKALRKKYVKALISARL